MAETFPAAPNETEVAHSGLRWWERFVVVESDLRPSIRGSGCDPWQIRTIQKRKRLE